MAQLRIAVDALEVISAAYSYESGIADDALEQIIQAGEE